jgi:hypothetical protein
MNVRLQNDDNLREIEICKREGAAMSLSIASMLHVNAYLTRAALPLAISRLGQTVGPADGVAL